MSILQEAEQLVNGDRNKSYGSPLENFTKVAKMWSVILNVEIKAEQVPLCMMALKLARESNKSKRDNIIDIAGYAYLLEKIEIEKLDLLRTK